MIAPFYFAATPNVHFGNGKLSVLPSLIKGIGNHVMLVTGKRAFINSSEGQKLLRDFDEEKITFDHVMIDREPSPLMIDQAVTKFSSSDPKLVVAIGGGSVLDAGKAIAAMMPLRDSVKYYLEGVGTKTHPGIKLPFIAVPTTSGTGSEATKNAVLSEIGENGYKKSLRHNNFVPDITIIDPMLTISCPAAITAASGMDAFTQLLESYLSTAANPITDALAREGLHRISKSLLKAYQQGDDVASRTDMALASYLSGITLANAGLGLVHGFASSIGGYFNIPHGVICSTLMSSANQHTISKLRKNNEDLALRKYAQVGKIFLPENHKSDGFFIDGLLTTIEEFTHQMKIPGLATGGVTAKNFDKILDASDNKNNPIKLSREEMEMVLENSL